jgi:hypothetical protein
MSEGLTGTRADWLSVWKAAAAARGFSYRAVDDRAGLTDGYFSRLACGDIKEPTAATIAAINRALDIRFQVTMGADSLDGVGGGTQQSDAHRNDWR